LDISFISPAILAIKTNFLKDALVQFFSFIHSAVQNIVNNPNVSYGLTIILVTIIIRLVLFPLNYKQIKSQVKMSEIQPEIKQLQAKYKNDPQKQQQEMQKLYKENGVNPLGGCLPLLLQWPILIALYYVFNNLGTNEPEIANATFLGLKLMGIAALNNPVTWILPLLSGALTYYSTTIMTSKNADPAQLKQTATMSIGMSIMITFMSFKFSTALVLYWVTNSVVQIAQTILMKKTDKKPVGKEGI
jgi:YidC/Oxa1 family membrane protein insertase